LVLTLLLVPGRAAEPDNARLAETVKRLVDEDFATREKAAADLVAAGLPAIPVLRAALGSPDLEMPRRAQQCLGAIDARPYLAEHIGPAKLLLGLKLPIDGPGLLAFLKSRTPSPDDQDRLARTVKQLGDDNFDVREKASEDLLAAGRAAIPFLRAAQSDPDLE